MALRFGVISADDHVQEPPDLWTKRLSSKEWGDRIPRIVKQEGGAERWVVDGKAVKSRHLVDVGALKTDRFKAAQTWSEVPKAAYDPGERLKAMDHDGVDVEVLYPSAAGLSGEVFCTLKDAALEGACVQAYNDWVLEVWGKASPRFVPQCILPLSTVDAAAKELKRSLSRGHRGVVMPPIPWHNNKALPHINAAAWDPLWAAIQEAGVPLCWHSGSDETIMLEIYEGFNPAMSRAFDSIRRPVSNAIVLANFLLGGIPERFPKLNTVFAAAGIDWVPFQIENSDHEWGQSMMLKEGMTIKPKEIFHRQCYVGTWAEKAALDTQRQFIGVDNILWQSEFPMETSTYPRSAAEIKVNFANVPKPERDKMLFGNAARLYKVQLGLSH